jgi:hypothetical protein
VRTHIVHDEAAVSIDVDSRFTPDPTSTPPEFALTPAGSSNPTGWVAGGWSTAWDASTRLVTATTPTIGGAGSLVVAPGNTYRLWQKAVAGGETFVDIVAQVACP